MGMLYSGLGRSLAVAGAVSFLALGANAADMYVPGPAGGYKDGPAPVLPWEGSYVGINGGFAWGNDSPLTAGVTTTTTTTPPPVQIEPPFSTSGGFGGGQIGHNWQRDHIVFGIEADIQGSDITGKGTTTATESGGSGTAMGTNSLDWFGTVRGRLGYAFDRALVYATGGFAYGGVQDKLSVTASYGGSSSTTTVQNDPTATGYAIGGGVEYALSPAWSVKAEYQYIDLGSEKLAGSEVLVSGVSPNPVTTVIATGQANFEHAYDTVRLGVNYHILPGYEPLK